MARPVVLVGMPGSGKSEAGRRVAARLHLPFVDCDEEVERRAGATVQSIFEARGEAHFRDAECAALEHLLDGGARVVATGGGVVLAEENRDRLRRLAFVVWLRASLPVLVARLAHDTTRPLLAGDHHAALAQLAAEREPLYREVADAIVDVDDLDLDAAADAIVAACRGALR